MESARRHGLLAWTTAISLSASAWAGHFSRPELSEAAFALFALASVAWVVAAWAGRLARKSPSAESRELALLRAGSSFSLAVFAFSSLAAHIWALGVAYPDPAINRAYAESMGLEMGPYFFASLAFGIVAGIVAYAAMRPLRGPEPSRAAGPWLACVLAPGGWALLAVAAAKTLESVRAAWTEFGTDLPSPTILVLASGEYLSAIAALALVLSVVAWILRARERVFRRIAVVQVVLLLLCSAYFTLAVVSLVLPLFKMCGAV